MIDWGTLMAASVGGLLGIGASIGGVELARRRQADQWQQELLMQVCGDALKSMQRYMREILNLAFADGPPYRREVVDGVEHVFPEGNTRGPAKDETFDLVVSDWNSSMHQLLVTAPAEIVSLSREVDAELDRLLDLAIDQKWSREAFRQERIGLGITLGEFVRQSRQRTGADEIVIANVWTWADGLAENEDAQNRSPL